MQTWLIPNLIKKSWTVSSNDALKRSYTYSEKTSKFCEIFTLLFTGTTKDKSKVNILQNFVAFSEYMNFSSARDYLVAEFCGHAVILIKTRLLPYTY